MTDRPRRAMLLMAGFAFAWVFVEEVLGSRLTQAYPLLEVVWCRYAVHLVLMVLVTWHNPRCLWRTHRRGFQLSRSMLMVVMPASFALSLQAGLPIGTVWALFWVSPLMVLLLARVVLGEFVSRWLWLTCSLAALASAAMMLQRGPMPGLALLLPLLMALSFAGYIVMTRGLQDETLQANLFYTAAGAFLALTPFVPWVWVTPTLHDAAALFGIGAVGLLALWALDRAVAHAAVSVSIPFLYVHLPALALAAWVVEGDAPTRRQAGGAILICAVVAWTARRATHRAQGRVIA